MSSSMDMTMSGMSASTTMTTAAAAATTSGASSSMDMGGMGMGGSCQISMLWNWTTIDACFLSSSWHITSNGMFAGSCIGVACLVVSMEFLRRLGREYDAAMIRKFQRQCNLDAVSAKMQEEGTNGKCKNSSSAAYTRSFRWTPAQQFVRATLHAVTFGVAYIIMLLAMYFNGYIIISIIIGAFLGKFLFDWGGERKLLVGGSEGQCSICPDKTTTSVGTAGAARGDDALDTTYCCG